jgi:hypothetical protein
VNELVLQGADLDASRIPDSFGEGLHFQPECSWRTLFTDAHGLVSSKYFGETFAVERLGRSSPRVPDISKGDTNNPLAKHLIGS